MMTPLLRPYRRPEGRQLFPMGQTVATPGALDAFVRTGDRIVTFLDRHVHGDWGQVDDGDWRANDQAIKCEARILSAYRLTDGTKIWIITEADRSATTILLPDEY